MPASEMLARELEAIRGAVETLSYERALTCPAQPGPGVTVEVKDELIINGEPEPPFVKIMMPGFRVQAKTDLDPAVCGLPKDNYNGISDFPGITPEPLTFAGGSQQAMAHFTGEGFTAAAYTEMRLKKKRKAASMVMPQTRKTVKRVYITVEIDRPFGFLAVEKETGLLLFVGWVTEKEWEGESDKAAAPSMETPPPRRSKGAQRGDKG